MRRGLLHALAWMLATGAAVTLSWFGVHIVLSATAYEPPRTPPVSGGGSGGPTEAGASPQASSTHRPESSPPPASEPQDPERTRSPGGPDSASGSAPGSRSPRDPAGSTPPAGVAAKGDIKSYTVEGGRVVLDMREASASLVSATPEQGWEMRVWKAEGWIRVAFSAEGTTVSVFCTWNGHPPAVETYRE